MIALYIIGGLLALIALLLSSPISVHFFCRETPELVLRIWGLPVRMLPRPSVEEAVVSTSEKAEQKTEKQKKDKPSFLLKLQESLKEDGIGTILQLLGELAGVLKRTIGRLLRAITVKEFRLQMRISGDDAASTAINYGRVCAAFYPLFGAVCAGMRVRHHDVDLRPDFAEEGSAVLVDITACVSLWRLTGAVIAAGWSLLWTYVKLDESDKSERTVNTNGRK